jgi:parallel beta-helix repeat protein
MFMAGPSEVFASVSHGLGLVQSAPSLKCHHFGTNYCRPAPKPSPTVTASSTPKPTPTPTKTVDPPTPTPTKTVDPPTPTPTVTSTTSPPSPTPTPTATTTGPPPPGAAPTSPPVTVCGNSAVLTGPSAAPAGAVTVPAGNNTAVFAYQLPANTTYYFASGTHYLGSGPYSQVQAGQNDTFIGAPGAIISGDDSASAGYVQNHFAFEGNGNGTTGVTIEYLTVENFDPPGSQGAINTNSNDNWTVEHDTVQNMVPGAALMLGSNNTIEYNCLTQNGQYGFNGYQSPGDPESSAVTGGAQNIVLSDNEISYNNTCNWDQISGFPIATPPQCAGAGEFNGCGCDGGGKFWQDQNVTVEDNYVHNNYNVGVWADTDNDGFDIQGNYFSGNYAEALMYEVSYNALIKDNAFVDNAWGQGPNLKGFPDSAVYISESGGDSRVPNSFGYSTLDIEGNAFTDNWGGVVLWENSNRFCGDGYDGACTLVDPQVATMATCPKALPNSSADQPSDTPDYFDLCRWKTQNVTVADNVFNFNPSNIGSDCTKANNCGFNGLFSEYGSTTPYKAWVVLLNISDHQHNVFEDNTYDGPWNFDGFALGDDVDWAQWTSGFQDPSGSNDFVDAQDAGSTFSS